MIELRPVPGLPKIVPGVDLAQLIAAALDACGERIAPGDLVVVTSKVVSKALGLYAEPGADRAELVLEQSRGVVTERRTSTGMTRVVAALAGPVLAGAGIDASNTGDERLLLLPPDPDAAARDLHAALAGRIGHGRFGVLLSDTSGRPWRAGLTDFALGLAGVRALDDLRGRTDAAGRDLAVTVRNLADAICASADLVKGKVDRVPVAIVRGLAHLVEPPRADAGAAGLVRSGAQDWFALGSVEAVRSALGVHPGTPAAYAVGVASVHPEPLHERVRRALAAAAWGEDEDCRTEVAGDATGVRVRVEADDPVALGRRWARIEVAAAAEGLRVTARRDADGLDLRVSG